MQEPLVSVIVTTYNREELLKETLLLILNQTYTDFELIVVDNYSNYEFFKLIEGFGDDRIRPFQNANNGIIAVNRNFGISKARGKYLAFCDDDDIWKPHKLQIQLETIEGGEYDLVSSNSSLFSDNIDNVQENTNYVDIKDLDSFLKVNPIITSSVLVKNDSRVRFDEARCFITVEDYKLWLSLYIDGFKMHIIKEPLIFYRLFPNNQSRQNPAIFKIRHIVLYASLLIEGKTSFWKSVFFILINLIKGIVKYLFI